MKKLLIGCGIVVLITVLVCIGVGTWGIIKFNQFTGQWQESFEELTALNDKYEFEAPADGDVDQERLDTFFEIREETATDFYDNETLKAIQEAEESQSPPDVGIFEIFGMIFTHTRETLDSFTGRLDQNEMSPKEYGYYLKLVYSTVAQGANEEASRMADIYNQMQEATSTVNQQLQESNNEQHTINFDQMMDQIQEDTAGGPAIDREIIQQHEDQFLDYPFFSFLELFLLDTEQQQPFEPNQAGSEQQTSSEPATTQ